MSETFNSQYQFPNGTPFDYPEKVNRVVDGIIKRKNQNKPVLIVLDGISSSGKTTKAIQIMDLINKKYGLPEVSVEKDTLQIGTGATDFINKLTKAADIGYPCIMFDEAGEYNRRGWNTQLNRVMDKILDTFRAHNIIIFMVLHDFMELPKHVWSTKIVTMLIHMKERRRYGRAYYYAVQRIYWIMHYRKTAIFPEAAYNSERYNFRIYFKNLELERAKKLNELSTSHKKKMIEDSQIKINGLVSMQDIVEKTGRSLPWIKLQIKKLKAMPEQTFKKRKYFKESLIDRINAQVKRRT